MLPIVAEDPQTSARLENYPSAPVVRPNWGRQAGAGRTKGTPNKITQRQREVAAMVLGEPGTPEFAEFVAAERKAALDQSMAPAIKALWTHYLLGIPKVSVEVEGSVTIEKIVREVIDVPQQACVELLEGIH